MTADFNPRNELLPLFEGKDLLGPKPSPLSGLPSFVVYAPTQTVRKEVERTFLKAHHSQKQNSKNRLIADCIELAVYEDFGILGPALGGPAAAVGCETLLISGLKRIALIGFAGGLRFSVPEIEIGDFVFPRGTLSEELTSRLYGGAILEDFLPSPFQLELERRLANNAISPANNCFNGRIWSTDSPFRETKAKALEYASMGAVAVEMECAAFFRLAALYGADAAACFVVSDLLEEKWVSGFKARRVRDSLSRLCNAIVNEAKR